jgi:hypothetical protein
VVTSILTFYSLRRINQYEALILDIEQTINFASEKVKLVDAKGHYESDDETGFFFEQLKLIQKLLDSIFEKETNEEKKNG